MYTTLFQPCHSVRPATCSTSFVTPSSYLSNDGFNRWKFYTGCSVCIVKSFLKTEPSWRNICARSCGTNESIQKIKNMTDSILSIIWSLEKHGRYVNSMSYHLLFILLQRFQLSFIIFYYNFVLLFCFDKVWIICRYAIIYLTSFISTGCTEIPYPLLG